MVCFLLATTGCTRRTVRSPGGLRTRPTLRGWRVGTTRHQEPGGAIPGSSPGTMWMPPRGRWGTVCFCQVLLIILMSCSDRTLQKRIHFPEVLTGADCVTAVPGTLSSPSSRSHWSIPAHPILAPVCSSLFLPHAVFGFCHDSPLIGELML